MGNSAMAKTVGELTTLQVRQIEQFLDLFSEIEQALKRRLDSNDHSKFTRLVDGYLKRNPFWAHCANQLRLFAKVRNLLTHERSTKGYPVAVTPHALTALEDIKRGLLTPETVADRYSSRVDCVLASATLADVVSIAFEKGYSQFPVLEHEQFVGLITENEVTRWLGRWAVDKGSEIRLQDVDVRTVIRDKDPFREGMKTFKFVRRDMPVEEVMGLFVTSPILEVVLLTENGKSKSEIGGIITQWDAARYPNGDARVSERPSEIQNACLSGATAV